MPEKERIWFVHWLRILAVFMLIPFYKAIAYVCGTSCYEKGLMISVSMQMISRIIGMWFIPLLFMIAGIGAFYSLKTRDEKPYVLKRLSKLLLLLVIGSINVVPVLTYYHINLKSMSENQYDCRIGR